MNQQALDTLEYKLAATCYPWIASGLAAHEFARNLAFAVAIELRHIVETRRTFVEVEARRLALRMLWRRMRDFNLRLLQSGRLRRNKQLRAAQKLARLCAEEIETWLSSYQSTFHAGE